MDVKESWLVSISAQQARQRASKKNQEFRKLLRASQVMRRSNALKLKSAALVAAFAWAFAGMQLLA